MFAMQSIKRLALTVAAVACAALAVPATGAASQIPGFDPNRPVEITNQYSGLKADVMWASQNAFQGAFLWRNNASASQEFDMLPSGGGYYRIRARHSGQCLMLDWRSGRTGNGTAVIQYPACDAGYAPAEWRVGTVGNASQCWIENGEELCSSTSAVYPILINRHSGRCLDAHNPSGGRPGEQAVLQQWTCIRTADDWNTGNQLFSIRNPR
jgi:Ricin-type beta-trefoil lectin domain-like